jgi:hypothetical protein
MVWLVEHREGSCATKSGKQHRDSATNVRTLCGGVVVLPGGSRQGEPECPDCRAALRRLKRKKP